MLSLANSASFQKCHGDQLRDAAERLVKTYPEDLNTSFPEEIVHFQENMNEPESDMQQSEKGENKGTYIALRMLQTIVNMKCKVLFQTCTFALRIYLSLRVTNYSGERPFSALKRIKNYLRSTLKDEKLNHLALMHVESSVLRKLNFNDVLDQFVDRLTRKIFK